MTTAQKITFSTQAYQARHWARFSQALSNKNLSLARSCAERLCQERGLAATDPAKIWYAVGQLAREQGRQAEGFELLLKARALSQDGELNLTSTGLLAIIALEIKGAYRQPTGGPSPTELNKIKTDLANFIHRSLPLTDLDQLPSQEQNHWFSILAALFPNRYFEHQHRLAQKQLQATLPTHERMLVALDYLFSCRRAARAGQALKEPGLIRQAAEYSIANLAEFKRNYQEWDSESFLTIIVTLVSLKLNDLVEKAVALFPPEPTDPLGAYLNLWRMYINGQEAEAYSQIIDNLKEMLSPQSAVDYEINVLKMMIIKRFLASEPAPSDLGILASRPGSFIIEALRQPRTTQPALVHQINQFRVGLLEGLRKQMREKAFALICSAVDDRFFPRGDEAPIIDYLIYLPGGEMITQFIYFNKCTIQVEFRLERDKNGRVSQVRPAANFPQTDQPPLIWEYLSLCLLANTVSKQLGDDSSVIKELQKIRQAIGVVAQGLYTAHTGTVLKELIADFHRDPEFFNPDQQEARDSRSALGRRILERARVAIVDGQFPLTSAGLPIYPLLDRIEFLEPQRIREKLFDQCCLTIKDGYFGVIFHLGNGRELQGIAQFEGGLPVVSFLGQEKIHDRELFEYIDEALMTALIDLFVHQPGKADPLSGGAAVIDQDGILAGLVGAADPALARLQSVYLEIFIRNIAEKGLLATDWFTYEPDHANPNDGLYKPLPKQSQGEKMSQLGHLGPEHLFIPVQPLGGFRRLRVGPKKGPDGQIGFYPWEPTELRQAQQELFQDKSKPPQRYGLYVVTTFQAGKDKILQHGFLFRLIDTIQEALDDSPGAPLALLKTQLAAGEFLKPVILLSQDQKKRRETLIQMLAEGRLTIKHQTHQIFDIYYTYCRPQMVTVGCLLEKGLRLTGADGGEA